MTAEDPTSRAISRGAATVAVTAGSFLIPGTAGGGFAIPGGRGLSLVGGGTLAGSSGGVTVTVAVPRVAGIVTTLGAGDIAFSTVAGAGDANMPSGGGSNAPKTPGDILTPGGSPVGRPGASGGIRRLNGGLDAAEKMFNDLAAGGKDITPPGYPGKLFELPGGGRVGLRPVSSSADKSPSIDINIPGVPVKKIHFEP